jgi:hypothetical protein
MMTATPVPATTTDPGTRLHLSSINHPHPQHTNKKILQQSVSIFFIYRAIDMLNKMYTIERTTPIITRFKTSQKTLWDLQMCK